MSPENWRRVDKIYGEVLEKALREREQFLDTACAEDPPEVRAKVEELLRSPQEEETTLFDEVRRRVGAVLPTEALPEFGGHRSPADRDLPWSPNAAVALDTTPPDVPECEILTPPVGERWPKEGGMGMVWRAHDLQFKRLLAVKVMKAKLAGSRWVSLFLREASITAQLAHPSIVPVHAMGRLADGRPYYTMKLVEGETLADKLRAKPDVKSRRTELLPVFARVCQALAFAHRKGVIHRDATPGNVMVGEHGEVQVMDWGLAKFLTQTDAVPTGAAQSNGAQDESNDRTRSGAVLGKWPYMPPEQANGKIEEVDRRSDVFGLGAILCEILTGRPPYVGPKADVMRQARNAELEDAYAELEKCGADAGLIDLARACLSAKPNDRPEDASVVEKRLTDYLASVEDRLRKAERDRAAAEARAKEAWRRMRWVAASAGLFLSLLLVTALFAWRESELHQKLLAATINRAMTAAMSADLDAADQLTTEAEQAGASPGQVHMLRGQIALHRGSSKEATQHLEEAVRLLPKSVAARGMLAAAYADDGNWERYDKAVREMEQLTPSTPEDFLFKGYAEAYLEPERGLQTMKQAFDRRPMMSIAFLLRAEVRAMLAQDTDNLDEAEGAVQDANYARELLHDNPTALWVSLEAHLAKAGVHEHRAALHQRRAELDQRRAELDQRRAELELAGKDADTLKAHTALPEAVVYRWTYFREVGREEEILDELRLASEKTDHTYVTFCCAMNLYRRGQPGDYKEALHVLERRRGTYNKYLLPFVLAEHDYPDKHDWPARARKASEDYTTSSQDGLAIMDSQRVLCLLGEKDKAVEASKALLKREDLFYTLRHEPILRCVRYNAGELSADELLRLAGRSQYDQCLAHYNIAMMKLAEGDREGAKEHFDKAVKTRAWGWGEYDLSWVCLSRLEKDRNWPPWIPDGRAK
jgi:tetratricopeptide (TPR) repeat protein